MGYIHNRLEIWVLYRQTEDIRPIHYPQLGNYGLHFSKLVVSYMTVIFVAEYMGIFYIFLYIYKYS